MGNVPDHSVVHFINDVTWFVIPNFKHVVPTTPCGYWAPTGRSMTSKDVTSLWDVRHSPRVKNVAADALRA